MLIQELKIGTELPCRPRYAARAGWTLIELLVVMSLAAGISSLAIAMLTGVLRANSQGMSRIAEQAVTFRLAERFRADVAAASQCRPIDAAQPQSGIVLQSANGNRVEYVPAPDALERIAYTGQEISRRETYQLGKSRLVKLQIGHESPTVVSCLLETSANASEPKLAESHDLAISAILGSDERFRRSATSSAEQQPTEQPATPREDKPEEAGDQ